MTSPDPESNLGSLVHRVWGPDDGSSPVSVSLSRVPEGHVVVERYAVIPNAARARFLVPLGSRAAAVNSFWKYNAVKPPKTRARQLALAGAFGTGAARAVFRDRVVVSIDSSVPPQARAEWLLMSHLADELGCNGLQAAMSVRRVNPNVKPTLQLFDPAGRPVGYAKVGWSEATREMVRTEADSLEAVRGKLSHVIAPVLVASGTWRDQVYAVSGALPETMRRWTTPPAADPDVLLDIANSGQTSVQRLAESDYCRGLRQAMAFPSDESRVLSAWLDRLCARPTPLRYGRWHGDWVAWNLGKVDGRVAAWDWEHSAASVPVGFDALHWHFQHTVPHRGLDAAVEAVDAAEKDLRAMGVADDAVSLVSSLYLLEMFVRSVRLEAGGGGWNPRLYPHMLAVAQRRDREAGRG